MSNFVSRFIAKQNTAVKAFWAPTLLHAQDIYAENIPPSQDMTPEFYRAYYSLWMMAREEGRHVPDSLKEKMRQALQENERNDPSKAEIMRSSEGRFNRHYRHYAPGCYLKPTFNEAVSNGIEVLFHEYEIQLDLEGKRAEVKMHEQFASSRDELRIIVPGQTDIRVPIEAGKTQNPHIVALEFKESSNDVYVDFDAGHALPRRRYNVASDGRVQRVLDL